MSPQLIVRLGALAMMLFGFLGVAFEVGYLLGGGMI